MDVAKRWPLAVRRSTAVLLFSLATTAGLLALAWAQSEVNRRVITGVLNLNHASQQDLQLLPGIGEVTAYRIVRLREQLGGFKSISDLERVPGISAAQVTHLAPYLTLTGPSTLRVRLDLNTATPAALARLPGISRQQAEAIVAFRQQHGAFRSLDELLEVGGIDAQQLEEVRELLVVLPPPVGTRP